MIIYSVTISIDNQLEHEWIKWMQTVHIPQVMATGCFVNFTFFRLLTKVEDEGATFNLQYHARSMEEYVDYQDNYAPALQEDMASKYRNQYGAFRTLLETVE